MITALISYSPNHLNNLVKSGDPTNIAEHVEAFDFLEVVRSFRSGRIVKVKAEVSSVDEIRARVGDRFVVELPSYMSPL